MPAERVAMRQVREPSRNVWQFMRELAKRTCCRLRTYEEIALSSQVGMLIIAGKGSLTFPMYDSL